MNRKTTDKTADIGGLVRKNDIVLIASILALLVLLGAAFLMLRKSGDTVTVSVDGQVMYTYSLLKDRTVDIRTGEDDSQLNRLVIKDAHAYVQTASCPDGICAAHRPISRNGEAIVCLPHRVVITIRTQSSEQTPDLIT